VVRFVVQLGFGGYSEFQQALRDLVDTEMTLIDRVDLSDMAQPGADRFRQEVFKEIDNLKQLYRSMDIETIRSVVSILHGSDSVFVVGSRLSYSLAYYFGWQLTKVRQGVQILKGSDSTSIDRLAIAPPSSLVVLIATSRYPNELIRIAKHVRRMGHELIVISDSSICPVNGFARHALVSPSRHIPIFGSTASLTCLLNYVALELSVRYGDELKAHQEKLEQSYRENDTLFNLDVFGE
jgi:DNA-binding MurR/RpiR family transcriptional regulator